MFFCQVLVTIRVRVFFGLAIELYLNCAPYRCVRDERAQGGREETGGDGLSDSGEGVHVAQSAGNTPGLPPHEVPSYLWSAVESKWYLLPRRLKNGVIKCCTR